MRRRHTLASRRLDALPRQVVTGVQINMAQVGGLIAELVLATDPATGTRWQQPTRLKHHRRMHRQTAQFEDVLANSRGVDLALPAARGIVAAAHAVSGKAGVEPLGGLRDARRHEMRHNVRPLAVPAEDATPHFVGAVRANLALEAARDGAQHDAERAAGGLAGLGIEHDLEARVGRELGQARPAEVRDELRAGRVEVGKVRRVGLVQVVVNLEERRARARDDVAVEGAGAERGRGTDDVVVDDRVEDAILGCTR